MSSTVTSISASIATARIAEQYGQVMAAAIVRHLVDGQGLKEAAWSAGMSAALFRQRESTILRTMDGGTFDALTAAIAESRPDFRWHASVHRQREFTRTLKAMR